MPRFDIDLMQKGFQITCIHMDTLDRFLVEDWCTYMLVVNPALSVTSEFVL